MRTANSGEARTRKDDGVVLRPLKYGVILLHLVLVLVTIVFLTYIYIHTHLFGDLELLPIYVLNIDLLSRN